MRNTGWKTSTLGCLTFLLLGYVKAPAEDSLLARQLVVQYLEESQRVREYYSDIELHARMWEKQEASPISCARLPIASESVLKYELHVWAKGKFVRVDVVGDPPGYIRAYVTWPGAPIGFSAARVQQERRWRFFDFRYPYSGIEEYTGDKQEAYIPFVMFSWGGWLPYEKYFLDSRAKVVAVHKVKQARRDLLCVDIEFQGVDDPDNRKRVSYNRLYFDAAAGWVPVFQEFHPRGSLEDALVGSSITLAFEYETSPDGIPLLKSLECRRLGIQQLRRDCTALVKFHTRYEVTKLTRRVSEEVFWPESLGISRWEVWLAWWRYWIWRRYNLGVIVPPTLYWLQFIGLMFLVSYIARRRWRGRRENSTSLG